MALIDKMNDAFITLTNLVKSKVDKTAIIDLSHGGTGATDVATARSNLGLGTVATYNAGTSANNVLLLNDNGYVPQSALNGTYKNTILDITSGGIYRATSSLGIASATAYGLGDISVIGYFTGVIVIKTTIPFSKSVVFNISIEGLSSVEEATIKMNIVGTTFGSLNKFNTGTTDIPVRKAQSSDGFLCFILGDVNTVLAVAPSISIISAHLGYYVEPTYLTGWKLNIKYELSSYTNISDFAIQSQSFIESSIYAKLANNSINVATRSIKAGASSYKKGWRKLIATLPSEAGEITVAHGVTTIESVRAKVTNSDNIVVFNSDIDPANQFYVRVNGANLILGVTANSTKVFGKQATIYVGEEL